MALRLFVCTKVRTKRTPSTFFPLGGALRLSTSQSPLSCSGSSGYLPGSVSPCSRMVPSSPICVYTQASFPAGHPGFTHSPSLHYVPFDLHTSLRLRLRSIGGTRTG